jgi:hypothetical protein
MESKLTPYHLISPYKQVSVGLDQERREGREEP